MRKFGVTNPEYLKALDEISAIMKGKTQQYWDNQMMQINKMCSKIRMDEEDIGAGSGD